MTSSIDGLVSGLSTSSMINSLMQVEAAPQTRLKSKVSAVEKIVTAYQTVNTRVAALKTAADNLSQLSTWRAVKPTVSSTSVTATAVGGTDTTTGAVQFDVKALAKAQAATIRVDTTAADTALNVPDTIEITVGSGTPVSVDVSQDKTAKGIAAAINAANAGVKVSLVKISTNESVLQLNGSKTGADNAYTIAGLENASSDLNGLIETRSASDALITVGDPLNGGYSLTNSTNTFTGLMSGVTLTVSKVEDGITLESNTDVSGIAAKVQALVDAANATLTEIKGQTAYNAETKVGSPLTGDFSVRQMSSAILGAVSSGQPDIGSLSKIGIALNSTGQLTFDAAKFSAAYNADPTTIQQAGTTFADTFETLGTKQTANLTSAITGRKNVIDSMNIQIDNWDSRLAAKREALQKTYATLEVSLSKLQSQSTWLSGQIAGLG